MTQPGSVPSVNLDSKRLFQLYIASEFEQLSADFLTVFRHLAATTYLALDDSNRASILRFLKVFLTLFTQPDYLIPEKYSYAFIQQNYLLSNTVAMTPFRNTDGFLELLRYQPSNFIKILTLYSARNTIRIDRRMLFDTDPQAASVWYNQFCEIYKTGLVREDVLNHFAEHLSYRDERMKLVHEMQEAYFGSTYVDGVIDREVKPFLNQVVRRSIRRLRCDNHPNPKKIAVISDTWARSHSVYRILAGYVKGLKKDFHLTLFHVLTERETLDTSMFDEVHRLEWRDGFLNVDPLLTNDFQVVFFPDVGMTLPSILLANHRIAPIQLCGLGHSVSTWGAEIDYFVSGIDVETPDAPERNYSERLVLLPGMGALHNRPLYEPTGRTKTVPEFVINCPWYAQKINARFCRTVATLIERSQRPLRLRLLVGSATRSNGYLPFVTDLRAALGAKAVLEILPNLPYPEYMGLLEEGDLTLDAFHFAGCNTIADNLFLRKPTVVWEGDKWYNRIGASMLRLAGLDEFICTSAEDYLDRALLLIHDDDRRAEAAARFREAELDTTVFSMAHAPSFCRAVEYLIANHEQLQQDGSRQPIVIS